MIPVGHELNFYMLPEDTIIVQEQLMNLASMKILQARSPTHNPAAVPSLDYREDGKQLLSLFLAREQDLAEIVMHYVDVQNYWTIDALRSPVIEFTGCFYDGKILRRGRVYYVEGYHEQGRGWIEKSTQFDLWAKMILDTMKKTLKRHVSDYIGPKAQSWVETSGGKLIPK